MTEKEFSSCVDLLLEKMVDRRYSQDTVEGILIMIMTTKPEFREEAVLHVLDLLEEYNDEKKFWHAMSRYYVTVWM